MTGARKTTAEALQLVFFSRCNPMIFCFDYNHSLENVLRAIDTQYFSIVPGEFTGIQPFQWPDCEEVRQCLFDTVKNCAGGADDTEEKVTQRAINSVMNHKDISSRSFSLLLQGIVDNGPGGCAPGCPNGAAEWMANEGSMPGCWTRRSIASIRRSTAD